MKIASVAVMASLIFIVFLASACHCSASNKSSHYYHNDEFYFAEKLNKGCKMYTDKCELNVWISKSIDVASQVRVRSTDNDVLSFESLQEISHVAEKNTSMATTDSKLDAYNAFVLTFRPHLVGVSYMEFSISNDNVNRKDYRFEYLVVIGQPERLIDKLFNGITWFFLFFISLLMGLLIDQKVVLSMIKMPRPLFVGFFSQYFFMPLLAFFFAYFAKFEPVEALALFIYGCCPGGQASANWTIIFDGEVNLSVILTFVSICASSIMLPAWLFTLGRVFSVQADIHIPFLMLFLNLLGTTGPLLIGYTIGCYRPNYAASIKKIIKPATFGFFLMLFIMVFIVKFYTFQLLKWHHWWACMVPWTGYLIGGIVAFLARLPNSQIRTIMIETGIQNLGVAFLIVTTNFPSPQMDFALVTIMAVAFLANIPLYVVAIVSKLYSFINGKCGKKKSEVKTNEDAIEKIEEPKCLESDGVKPEELMKMLA